MESIPRKLIEHTIDFSANCRAARSAGDQSHFADHSMTAETAHTYDAIAVHSNKNANATLKDEMPVVGLVRLDDRLLARLQRVIEVRAHDNVFRIESVSMEDTPMLRAEVDQHKPGPCLRRRFLDLRKAVRGRGVNARDQPKIEQQETTLRPARKQRLNLLIETAGRTEEQIALQGHPLKLSAVRCQKRKLHRASIDRAAIF